MTPVSAVRLAALTIALAACAATAPSVRITDSLADSMIGRSAEQVTGQLGPPLARDGATLTYETRRSAPSERQSSATVSLGGGGATSSSLSVGRVVSRCQWQFRLDSEAVVTGWEKAGSLCTELDESGQPASALRR